MKDARDLNIFIERGLRIGIIGSIASFVGASVTIMLAASFTTEHFENPRTMVLELLGSVLGSTTVWLVILSIILAIVYQGLYRPLDHVRINFRNITNGLVYLFALTPFLYVFRPGFLAIAVVCVGLLAGLTGAWEPRESMGRFKGVVLVFAVLFLIGIGRAWTGVDDVRARIPLSEQFNWILAYVHAVVVYFVVRRNGWRTKEFETFFKIILVLGTLVSIESLVVFYFGGGTDLEIFGRTALLGDKGLFRSMWIGDHHTTARIALTMLFVSLYFFSRYRGTMYLAITGLGGILLFSTLNRQVIISAVLGLMVVSLLIIRGEGLKDKSRRVFNTTVFYPSLVIIGLLLIVAVMAYSSHVRQEVMFGSVYRRSLLLIRGLDVWYETWLWGTGPFLVPYFLGSSFIPATVSPMMVSYLGISFDQALLGITREGVLVTEGLNSYTLHNLWFQFILEWGIVGFALVVYLWHGGWKLFRQASEVARRTRERKMMTPVWILFGFAGSLSFSVFFTSKFYVYWYFVLVFLFLRTTVREAMVGLDR